MQKILSRSGDYFYIKELGLIGMGWLCVDAINVPKNGDWLPFAFWELKSGETVKATPEDVKRYRRYIADIQHLTERGIDKRIEADARRAEKERLNSPKYLKGLLREVLGEGGVVSPLLMERIRAAVAQKENADGQ